MAPEFSHGGSSRGLSSGHETWLAGKWTIEIADFPNETSIDRGFSWIFQLAMFDDTGGYMNNG